MWINKVRDKDDRVLRFIANGRISFVFTVSFHRYCNPQRFDQRLLRAVAWNVNSQVTLGLVSCRVVCPTHYLFHS